MLDEASADADALLRAALGHHRAGEMAAAAALLERMLDRDARETRALLLLALVRDARDEVAEAMGLLRRYLALRPADGFAWHRLGRLHQARGEDVEACGCFAEAACLRPNDAAGLNDLGAARYRLGEPAAALVAFERAVALDPLDITARANRARLLDTLRRPDDALAEFRAVLATPPRGPADRLEQAAALQRLGDLAAAEAICRAVLDAAFVPARLLLADILDQAGRRAEAADLRVEIGRGQGVVRRPCLGYPVARVLLIGGAGACNLPTDFLIDRTRFEILAVQAPPDAAAAAGFAERVGPVDVAFNIVGDPDAGAPFLPAVAALAAALGCRLLNPPACIAPTRRDRLPKALDGIAGLLVPHTMRLEEPAPERLPPAPLLVRRAGAHGGEGLVRATSDAERDAAIAACGGNACYLTAFHDTRSPDGWFRKYRFVFVGGAVFPVHLAICGEWLAHYWRADMTPWMLREEADFLADPRGVFGDGFAAVEAVARTLGLDYGGMDCTRLPDRRVLVFEANATMLVHADGAFAAKRAEAVRVRDAMSALLTL